MIVGWLPIGYLLAVVVIVIVWLVWYCLVVGVLPIGYLLALICYALVIDWLSIGRFVADWLLVGYVLVRCMVLTCD